METWQHNLKPGSYKKHVETILTYPYLSPLCPVRVDGACWRLSSGRLSIQSCLEHSFHSMLKAWYFVILKAQTLLSGVVAPCFRDKVLQLH